MSRRKVVEVLCNRCGKTENQVEDSAQPAGPEFVVTFHGKTTAYDDLCTSCRNALSNYYDRLVGHKTKPGSNQPPPKAPEPEKKKGLFG